MPVYLRNWYLNKLAETRKEENKEAKKQSNQVHRPGVIRK